MEDIEASFIPNIPIKNLKTNVKAGGSPITLITFSLVRSSDRTELLKSGFTRNFELTLKEVRKPLDKIKNLRKEISEFRVNLEFAENELHDKMAKLQEKHENINNAVEEIYILLKWVLIFSMMN